GSVVNGYRKAIVLEKAANQKQLSDYVSKEYKAELFDKGEIKYGYILANLFAAGAVKNNAGAQTSASSGRNVWKLDLTEYNPALFPVQFDYEVSTSSGASNDISVALKEKDGIFTVLQPS